MAQPTASTAPVAALPLPTQAAPPAPVPMTALPQAPVQLVCPNPPATPDKPIWLELAPQGFGLLAALLATLLANWGVRRIEDRKSDREEMRRARDYARLSAEKCAELMTADGQLRHARTNASAIGESWPDGPDHGSAAIAMFRLHFADRDQSALNSYAVVRSRFLAILAELSQNRAGWTLAKLHSDSIEVEQLTEAAATIGKSIAQETKEILGAEKALLDQLASIVKYNRP